MFKVECPGCRAPYQVDERRVPSTGLKMRCPKCGTSFQVEAPNDPRRTGPSPVLGVNPPGGSAGADLPARAVPKGTMIGVAPAFANKPPAPAPAAPVAASDIGELDLPTVGGRPAAAPSAGGAIPRPGGPPPAPRRPQPSALDVEADLPAPRAPAPIPAATKAAEVADLPAVPRAAPPAVPRSIPRPGAAAPKAAAPRPVAPEPAAARAAAPSFGELDLDLPALGGPRTPEPKLDLPSPRAPEVAKQPSVDDLFGELELPSPVGDVELPSPLSGGRQEARGDLPAARGPAPSRSNEIGSSASGAGLPALSQPELPALSGAGLPAVSQASLPSLAESALPLVSAAGLPSARPKLPSISPDAGGFELDPLDGGLDLDLEPAGQKHERVSRPPTAPPAARQSFGEIDLGADPFAPRGSVAPRSGQPSDAGLEADPFGAPLTAPISSPSGLSRSEPPFGRSQVQAPGPVTRASGGGTSYGEVNLEGAAGSELPIEREGPARVSKPPGEESMEFGAIPQEAAPQALRPVPAQVKLPPPTVRKGYGVRVFAALFVVAVGGASLALVPDVGPFGAYWISDKLKADEYARLLDRTASEARRALSSDTALDANRASQIADQAQQKAKRVPALKAHAAFVGYLRELRFGGNAPVRARAKVLLDELAEVESAPYLELARAARSAVEGQAARAKNQLQALERKRPKDPDLLVVKGELALREADAGALAIWEKVDQVEKSARTAYGVARAQYAAHRLEESEADARRTLTLNPSHVGARILLARLMSQTRPHDPEAVTALESIVKAPAGASSQEIVTAQTLLGDIHLGRSRISMAENAYKAALAVDPTSGRALAGLGEAIFRAGRYSEALARFEAALQASPKDLDAAVGVAKTKLLMERPDDALGALRALSQTNPKSAQVAYWYGRSLESLGERDKALAVYAALLKEPPSDPTVVDVYVALALLQSQMGLNEQAKATLAKASAALPSSPAIHRALGELALSEGRQAEAESQFVRALGLDAGDLAARFKLGVAERRQGKFDLATKTFDQVAASDPDYPGLALERGLLFEASGRTDEALKSYESALAKAPNDPDLMLRVGCGNVAAGRGVEGEKLLRKVLVARPNSAETNHCLGRALFLQGRLADAQRLLDRAVELDPNRAEYHLYVGWVASDSGNFAKAETALNTALKLDQALADAYWQRGVLRSRQGAVRDAIVDLERALALRPSRYEAHAALADALYDFGKERQALVEWKLAIDAQPDNAQWRFRYGRLLVINQQAEAGREQLARAIAGAEQQTPPPRWLWEAHHMMARAIGNSIQAAPHWEAFLRLGPPDSPYRGEAKAALSKLGKPWPGP